MSEIELRRLELRDLNGIEEIERSSYPTPWSRSMFAGELAKPSSICLGAFDTERDELVGYLISHRRQGIASLLLNRLFELTGGRSRRGYTLEVRVSNAGAIKLYEELGFRPRGVRRGYYTDNREDALIMWKDPVSEPATHS